MNRITRTATALVAGLALTAGLSACTLASPAQASTTCSTESLTALIQSSGYYRIILPDSHGQLRETYDGHNPKLLGAKIMAANPSGGVGDFDQVALARKYKAWIETHASTYGTTWSLGTLMDDGYLWSESPDAAMDDLADYGCAVTIKGTTPRDPAIEKVRVKDAGKNKVRITLMPGFPGLDTGITKTTTKVTLYRWWGSTHGKYRHSDCSKLAWKKGDAKRARKVASRTVSVSRVTTSSDDDPDTYLTIKTRHKGCTIAVAKTPGERTVSKGVRIR